MKRILFTSLIAFGCTFSGAAMANTTLPLDLDHTSATFTVPHLSISKVSGTIPLESAKVQLNSDGFPVAATATFDLTRLDTRDSKRDQDLVSPHWFDAAQYPTMKFVSTVITPQDHGDFLMKGLLTFHGQTHPVTLHGNYAGKVTDPVYHKTHYAFSADGRIDRTEWGVGNAPAALVGNDVDIAIQAEAVQ